MKPGPRELPIIFTAESVRAILEGRKTQTRRVILWPEWAREHDKIVLSVQRPCTGLAYHVDGRPRLRFTPRFRVGDVLWVKEAWNIGRALRDSEGIIDDEMLWPGPAPKEDPRGKRIFDDWAICYRADGGEPPWRSPLYMPRWASRIAREVTEVRAQRVQDISEEDAIAEGCSGSPTETPREQFAAAWDRINGKRSPFAKNDWVFAYTFRRVEK